MTGPLDELECVHGLVHVVDWWGDVADDEGEGIACEGVLEKSGKFRFSERGNAFSFAWKTGDHLAESGERLIDILQLLEMITVHILAFIYLFGACEIAKIESCFLDN